MPSVSMAAVVVFTCPAGELRQLDIEHGPCVARDSDRRPLVSPLRQHEGDELAQLADLHRILGIPDEPWSGVTEAGGSSLATFSDAFRAALAGLADGDLAAKLNAVGDRWLRESTWGRPMQLGGVRTLLASAIGSARDAVAREQQLYGWHGPAVPTHVIATGSAGTYEAFRRSKRRRS